MDRATRKKEELERFLKNLGLPGFKIFSYNVMKNIVVPPNAEEVYDKGFDMPNGKNVFRRNIKGMDQIITVNTFTGKKAKYKSIEFWDKDYNKYNFKTYKDFKEHLIIMKLSGLLDD